MEGNSINWRVLLGVSCGLLLGGCTDRAAVAPTEARSVQVIAVKAVRQTVSVTLPQVGTIAPNEMVEIKSETDGVVEGIHYKEGQEVQKGQLLIQLNQGKLAALLAEAESNYSLSKANFERAQQLFHDKLISGQEFDQIGANLSLNQATVELRRRQLTDTTIVAPFKGIVGARSVSPGQVISRNTTLTWLVDDDPVKVEFQVPERFISQLRTGLAIEVKVAAFEDRRFLGEVFFLSPYIDQTTRTSLVKARVPNPDHELKAGMFANLELVLQVRENSVVIPEASLNRVLGGERATVWTANSNLIAEEREIIVGFRMPGKVEVLSGLTAGEDVVVEGVQKLAPGARIRFAPAEAAKPYLQEETDR
ncbi:MAG: efflux RND transporter periplasmic adaptor subunit [Verrucomicrobia bacterium]|nr:efflux RND transporter periplasmic adaptor subunit [Verrucomicrobiota bacterium]